MQISNVYDVRKVQVAFDPYMRYTWNKKQTRKIMIRFIFTNLRIMQKESAANAVKQIGEIDR